jgi:murein DD-endopeptidase MepM/ murein hydrolase activator NlpD
VPRSARPKRFPRADWAKLTIKKTIFFSLAFRFGCPALLFLLAFCPQEAIGQVPAGTRPIDGAEAGDYPNISRLDTRDSFFKQYLDDVESARRNLRRSGLSPEQLAEPLRLYSYTPADDEDIFRLAARCNIPYAGLATLNRIGHPSSMGRELLLPSVPGVFLPETPNNELERLMASAREQNGGVTISLNRNGRTERFLFFPGSDFSNTERTYFLNSGFRFPLVTYRITSPFGIRPSPFTGKLQDHRGLDLAAPQGTAVYAAREGTVVELGNDPVYGNYIIVAHDDNWVSLYGHLSSITTKLKSAVTRESIIGKVGSTGQSTGPHLHFEVRKNGAAMDPGKVLFK